MARILLVDDDHDMRYLIQQALSDDGHTFAETGSGTEALEILAKTEFDVIILDRRMPNMGGIEFLRRLKILLPNQKAAVLMCTSLDSLAKVEEALAAGAADYIVKPLDLEKLRLKVKTLSTRR